MAFRTPLASHFRLFSPTSPRPAFYIVFTPSAHSAVRPVASNGGYRFEDGCSKIAGRGSCAQGARAAVIPPIPNEIKREAMKLSYVRCVSAFVALAALAGGGRGPGNYQNKVHNPPTFWGSGKKPSPRTYTVN